MADIVKVDGERPGLGNPPVGPWLDGIPGDKGHLAWGQGGVGVIRLREQRLET